MSKGRLTAEQRAALDALPRKRKAFVLAFVGEAKGVAIEAARLAGYAVPNPEGTRLLADASVRSAIKALAAPAEASKIASIEELRSFWTSVARGEVTDTAAREDGVVEVPATLTVRLRASELLGKSQGAFLERVEHSGHVDVRALPWAIAAEVREARGETPALPDGDDDIEDADLVEDEPELAVSRRAR